MTSRKALFILLAVVLTAISSPASAQTGAWIPPKPIPPLIPFEQACMQSGGAAGSFMPTSKPSGAVKEKKLLASGGKPVLFTFSLATGSTTVRIRWSDATGAWQPEEMVSGPETLTVTADRFTLKYDDSQPLAWCVRATPL